MNKERCIQLVAGFELFRDFVYDDATWPSKAVSRSECTRVGGQYKVNRTGGTASIGYGETDAFYLESRWASGVTEPEARARLAALVQWFADGVAGLVERPMTDHQHEAMTSLAYNIGLGGFGDSTVLRKFNAGDVAGAAEAFLLWVTPSSLRTRRLAEIAHFLTPDKEPDVADLENLHPTFRERVINACEAIGSTVRSGARSTKRQRELYEDYLAGRGNPANPPGLSWHEFGDGLRGGRWALAVDFTEPYPHGQPGLVFPIAGEPWHGQPAEITETARVAGADARLPFPRIPTSEEDELFSDSPVDETVHLVALHSRLLLTSTSDDHGAKIVQAPANGSLNQRWMVYGHEDGTISLVNRAGGLALDRPDGAWEPGTVLQVAGTEFNTNQRWRREVLNGGALWRLWVAIDNDTGTNVLVDVAGASGNEGDLAILWTAKPESQNPANQYFIPVPTR